MKEFKYLASFKWTCGTHWNTGFVSKDKIEHLPLNNKENNEKLISWIKHNEKDRTHLFKDKSPCLHFILLFNCEFLITCRHQMWILILDLGTDEGLYTLSKLLE